jgi:glyoxylase-like metal-dependent hydrolase (beta-lactamase superfamily II)
MRIALYGGFAEKGRTCFGIEGDGYRVLIDAGVKTSARGHANYYPAIEHSQLATFDAIVITHAHEDHVAALGFLLVQGFRGRILMTPETQAETEASICAYGEPSDVDAVRQAAVEPLALGADVARLGPFTLSTGRSGHIAGGVWCRIDDGRTSLVYCSDIAPSSPVFALDPIPHCDALIIDASYGDDATSFTERSVEIQNWIRSHDQGSVLATPLYGRSAELLAIVPEPCALAPGMRDALRRQIDETQWLASDASSLLRSRLQRALDWSLDEPLPAAPLLCHDGMGMSGTSPVILERARSAGHAALFTGHLPSGSLGERMVAHDQADWIRLPTHPTMPENVALIAKTAPKTVLGHSCDIDALRRLRRQIPGLQLARTGDRLEIG